MLHDEQKTVQYKFLKLTLFIKDILGESVGQSIRVECEGLGA